MREKDKRINELVNNVILKNNKISPIPETLEAINEIADLSKDELHHDLSLLSNKVNEQYYKAIDKRIKKAIKNTQVACEKGCSHCCKNTGFAISPMELDYLVDELNKIEDETIKATIVNNLQRLAEEFKSFKSKNQVITTDTNYLQRILSRNNNVKYDCPFLINEECAVYEARPVICRAYLSKSKDICLNTGDADNILNNIAKESFLKLNRHPRNIIKLSDEAYIDMIYPFFGILLDKENLKFYSNVKYIRFAEFLTGKAFDR